MTLKSCHMLWRCSLDSRKHLRQSFNACPKQCLFAIKNDFRVGLILSNTSCWLTIFLILDKTPKLALSIDSTV